MQRWKPSGARLNARPWKEANNGPRIGFDGSYSNSSKRLITGAGSTALWGINHLWTSNKTTTKNGKDRVKYCDHKKGGREECMRSIRDILRAMSRTLLTPSPTKHLAPQGNI